MAFNQYYFNWMISFHLLITSLITIIVCQATDQYLSLPLSSRVLQKAEGSNLYVLCQLVSEDHHPDSKLEWFGKDGKKITTDNGGAGVHVEYGDDKCPDLCPAIIFQSIKKSDAGDFTCRGKFNGQDKETKFNLKIYKRITFDNAPKVQDFTSHTDASVICEVSGEPAPQVDWQRKGKRVTRSSSKYIITKNGLIIRNISRPEDTGIYTCRAKTLTSDRTEMEFRSINVRVFYKPSFPQEDQELQYSWLTGKRNLTCKADGLPVPSIHWFKDGKKVHNKDEGYKLYEDGSGSSTVQVIAKDEEYFGNYSCRARNKLGHAEQRLQLLQAFPPSEAPSMVKASVESAHTVKLEILPPVIPGPLDVLGYYVQYKLGLMEGWKLADRRKVTINDLPLRIDKLKTNTQYVFRVSAYNAAGEGDEHVEVDVRTSTVGRVAVAGVGSASRGAATISTSHLVIPALLYITRLLAR